MKYRSLAGFDDASRKPVVFIVLLLCWAFSIRAQPPNWHQPTGYQYSMTLTGVMVVDGDESRDENDMVAAFVGNDVRGVAQPVYEPSTDRYFIFLTIFSQQVSGEEVNFQMYSASTDRIVSCTDVVNFVNNESLGTISNPIVLKNNNAPTDIGISHSEIQENVNEGETALTFDTEDEDAGDEFVYELISGDGDDHNSLFRIAENRLLYDSVLNFELFESNELSIRVQSTDASSESVAKALSLTILDVNDLPTGIESDLERINENSKAGSRLTAFHTVDEDEGDTFTYALVEGDGDTDNAFFTLSGEHLEVKEPIDFEENPTINVRIKSTDKEGKSTVETFQWEVNDLNDQPLATVVSENRIASDVEKGDIVGKLSTEDQDIDDSFTYAFVEGENDNDLFSIDGNRLLANSSFGDLPSPFVVQIKTADKGGLTIESEFIFEIAAISMNKQSIGENEATQTEIGAFHTDAAATAFTYTLVAGDEPNDNRHFSISEGKLLSATTFNYEEKDSYLINVKSTSDDGFESSRTFTIEVLDANDVPESVALSASIVAENAGAGALVGLFTTEDQDTKDRFTYQLLEGDEHFSIAGDSLFAQMPLNYEEQPSYTLRIRSTDIEGSSVEAAMTVSVADAPDVPDDLLISSVQLKENAQVGTIVGELSTEDQDARSTFFYQLAGVDFGYNNSFYIQGNRLMISETFDHEATPSIIIRLSTTDNTGLSLEKEFLIDVLDVNEAPSVSMQEFEVEELAADGTVIATIEATDEDAGQELTFAITNAGGPFVMSAAGELSVASGSSIDFEEKDFYILDVTVIDNGEPPIQTATAIQVFVVDVAERGSLPVNNFLSPNGDGKNDLFLVQNIHLYQGYTLIIMNQNGNEVYRKANYANDWGGTNSAGKALPAGTYYYRFENRENPLDYKGTITIAK